MNCWHSLQFVIFLLPLHLAQRSTLRKHTKLAANLVTNYDEHSSKLKRDL